MSGIEFSVKDLTERFISIHNASLSADLSSKSDVSHVVQGLIGFYSNIFSYRLHVNSKLRSINQNDVGFRDKTRELILKGYCAEDRERIRIIDSSDEVKKLNDLSGMVDDCLDYARRLEAVLNMNIQNLVLDFKLSHLQG